MTSEKRGKERGEPNGPRYILTESDSAYTIVSILILFVLNTVIVVMFRSCY